MLLGGNFLNLGTAATFVRNLVFELGTAATFVRSLFQVSQSTIFGSSRIAWPHGSHGSVELAAESSAVGGSSCERSIGKSGLF